MVLTLVEVATISDHAWKACNLDWVVVVPLYLKTSDFSINKRNSFNWGAASLQRKEKCTILWLCTFYGSFFSVTDLWESIQLQGAKPCDPTGGVVPGPCMCVFIETGISQSEVCSVTISVKQKVTPYLLNQRFRSQSCKILGGSANPNVSVCLAADDRDLGHIWVFVDHCSVSDVTVEWTF